MEGGNPSNISLDSNLDISSSDMLVSVNQPTFQHNWQKFQGKFLPNSLRMEKNGWAAGWNVYNFEYKIFRKEIAEGLWGQLVNLNSGIKALYLYDSETSYNMLAQYIVIPNDILISGTASLTNRTLSGTLNGKTFSLNVADWTITDGFTVEHSELLNHYTSIIVYCTNDSYNIDFDLLLVTPLTGDNISETKFTSISSAGLYTWGNYTYDPTTSSLTTPEGTTVTATQNGSQITFDYDASVTDETIPINFALAKFYPQFNSLYFKDCSNESKQIGGTPAPSLQLAYDLYDVSTEDTSLVATDIYDAAKTSETDTGDGSVAFDWKLPLWATCGVNVARPTVDAKFCNNVANGEVAVQVGSYYPCNIKVKWQNAFDLSLGAEALADGNKDTKHQYITGLTYRFNQILLGNTISPADGWQPKKVSIVTSEVWYKNTHKWSAYGRKDSASMKLLLGDIYTYGTFSIDLSQYVDYNEPYDWWDSTNCVYTQADISKIRTVKDKSEASSTEEGNDQTYIENLLTTKIGQSIIATLKSGITVTEYTATSAAKTAKELYDNTGMYIGGTYSTVATNYADDYWPFSKVPRFNVKLNNGTVVSGCYWTDGTSYIDNLVTFKTKVRGSYVATESALNTYVSPDSTASRSRVVTSYHSAYDFEYKRRADFNSDEAYAGWVAAFKTVWDKYYPSYVDNNPFSLFDDNLTYEDTTYLDYTDISKVSNVTPTILYAAVGSYVYDEKDAVPFNTDTGLIIYDDNIDFTLTPFLYHHTVDKLSLYAHKEEITPGVLYYETSAGQPAHIDLPGYFGTAVSQPMIVAKGTTNTSTAFSTDTVSRRIASGVLEFGIRTDWEYIYVGKDETYEGVTYTEETRVQKVEYTDEDTTTDTAIWFNNVHFKYSSGTLTKVKLTYATGVDLVDSSKYQYYVGDINNGIKVAVPVWAHSAAKLTYATMRKESNINEPESFAISTSEDTSSDSKIYWDRSTGKSIELWHVERHAAFADDQNGSGYYSFKLVPTDTANAGLWYAQKQIDSANHEIFSSYYMPGVAFGNKTSTEGHLTFITGDYPILKLTWVPEIYTMPDSLVLNYTPANSIHSMHSYFSTDYRLLTLSYTLDEFDIKKKRLGINLSIASTTFKLYYDVVNKTVSYVEVKTSGDATTEEDGGEKVVLDSANEKVTVTGITGSDATGSISLTVDIHFKNNVAGLFGVISNEKIDVTEASTNIIKLSVDGRAIEYNYIQGKTILPDGADTSVTVSSYTGAYTKQNKHSVNLFSKGNTVAYTLAIANVTNNGIVIKYNDTDYTVNLSDFTASDEDALLITSCDIRKPDVEKVIAKINPASEYQLIKQQWNSTVEVENFWWVDATHILELNQEYFTLKRKTSELDDWNGDRFEKLWDVVRAEVLDLSVAKYFVTNCYNTAYSAFFVTIQPYVSSGSDVIRVKLFSIRNKFELYASFDVQVNNRDIGMPLNTEVVTDTAILLNTYNAALKNEYLLSKAIWTNTIVDNRLILGIHFSTNFDQWAIVYNLDTMTVEKCVQGYGFVGLHGDLTGGQIPDAYFDAGLGFNGTVQDLSALGLLKTEDLDNLDKAALVENVADIYNIDPKVVGTAEQQWYIQKELHGIVSHLTYKDGTFTKQVIPLTNNYTASFGSPSWASSLVADNMVQVSPLASFFKFDGVTDKLWKTSIGLLGYPLLYSYAPRYGSFLYVNMTFGQYAYVHYNSSKEPPEMPTENDTTDSTIDKAATTGNTVETKHRQTDPTLNVAYSFDKQKFVQNLSVNLDTSQSIIMILVLAFGATLQEFTNEKLSVNEEVGLSTVKDTAKVFTDNVVENTTGLISSSITSRARATSAISGAVTGLKSLNMFYSTSDRQRVFAGPGYVEHQFVAQCVAQSSTTLNTEGKVYQLYWALTSLTVFEWKCKQKIAELAIDALKASGDAIKDAGVCGTTVAGAAAAAGLYGAANALEVVKSAQKIAMETLEKVLLSLSPEGLSCSLDGSISRKNLSAEATHKYGEKNEEFMWPCWGVYPNTLKYTDETVAAGTRNTPWQLKLCSRLFFKQSTGANLTLIPLTYDLPKYSQVTGSLSDFYDIGVIDDTSDDELINKPFSKDACIYRAAGLEGPIPYLQAACFGETKERYLPNDMAKIEGVKSFLPNVAFKNENISCSEPAFTSSLFQDYKIDESWDLGMCATYSNILWLSVKDTKITNCEASNMFVNSSFCGIATPYTAIEVKRGLSKAYMRPYAITPNTLAFNCTGYNTILDNKLYHSFDGTSYRLVDWVGSAGMNKNRQTFFYSFQRNDRFKRSSIMPPEEFQGNFEAEPTQALDTIDELFTLTTIASKEIGLVGGTVGEDKDAVRWSIPVFTEPVTMLPAAVKTLTAMPLLVAEGVTTLTTTLANNQTAYKAPLSIDFTIGKNVYRQTEEYICSVQTSGAIDIITDIIPSLGLTYIGSSPTEAYFYSKATRHYYLFTGSNLTKMNMMERFRDIQKGYWDFVEQHVIMPCLMTYKRLNEDISDKDTETDNIIVPILDNGQVNGELPPPVTTIFNDRSWYKCYSLPSGFVYQGPNRVILNRSVFVEFMLDTLKDNIGKWKRLPREKYSFKREYQEEYTAVNKTVSGINGWTYNPFLLVTSALGNSESTDCIFEWVITFCWPIEMDLIYKTDDFAVVNIMAETMTPGGRLKSRPTHVFLTKELFTRSGSYGYYSFRFQSKNGAGNRERLKIWSDQYIAISSLVCESKSVTSRRTDILTQQVDVQRLHEL